MGSQEYTLGFIFQRANELKNYKWRIDNNIFKNEQVRGWGTKEIREYLLYAHKTFSDVSSMSHFVALRSIDCANCLAPSPTRPFAPIMITLGR